MPNLKKFAAREDARPTKNKTAGAKSFHSGGLMELFF
jgi:hypothetical protein